ncbi:MAG: hypothetical protein B7Z30_11700, partial [Rhizobiales bacterium 12-68-15]
MSRAHAAPDTATERKPESGPFWRDRRRRRRGTRRVLAIGLLSAGLAVTIVLAVGFASFREFAASNRLREELIYSFM